VGTKPQERGRLVRALLAVVATVTTGMLGADDIPKDPAIRHILHTHKDTGLIILGLTTVLTLWSFWQAGQRPKAALGCLPSPELGPSPYLGGMFTYGILLVEREMDREIAE